MREGLFYLERSDLLTVDSNTLFCERPAMNAITETNLALSTSEYMRGLLAAPPSILAQEEVWLSYLMSVKDEEDSTWRLGPDGRTIASRIRVTKALRTRLAADETNVISFKFLGRKLVPLAELFSSHELASRREFSADDRKRVADIPLFRRQSPLPIAMRQIYAEQEALDLVRASDGRQMTAVELRAVDNRLNLLGEIWNWHLEESFPEYSEQVRDKKIEALIDDKWNLYLDLKQG